MLESVINLCEVHDLSFLFENDLFYFMIDTLYFILFQVTEDLLFSRSAKGTIIAIIPMFQMHKYKKEIIRCNEYYLY